MVSGRVFGNMTFSEGVLGIYPGGWGWSFKCLGGITEACPGGVEQNQEACPRMVLYIVPGGGRGGGYVYNYYGIAPVFYLSIYKSSSLW